jgi:hypothetical protein
MLLDILLYLPDFAVIDDHGHFVLLLLCFHKIHHKTSCSVHKYCRAKYPFVGSTERPIVLMFFISSLSYSPSLVMVFEAVIVVVIAFADAVLFLLQE